LTITVTIVFSIPHKLGELRGAGRLRETLHVVQQRDKALIPCLSARVSERILKKK
jgi:hypothetical protein